jgi:hypothetical protein
MRTGASSAPLLRSVDPAILRLARALARQAAREDHAREEGERRALDERERREGEA